MKLIRFPRTFRLSLTAAAALILLAASPAHAAQSLMVDCDAAVPPAGWYGSITAALAALTSPSVPPPFNNVINVSGTCNEEGAPIVQGGDIIGYQGLQIAGFRQLIIRRMDGAASASITQSVTACGQPTTLPGASRPVLLVSDSQGIALQNIAFAGGQGVSIESSVAVGMQGVTIQQSRGNGITVGVGSTGNVSGRLAQMSAPSLITDSCSAGIFVNAGATFSAGAGLTIQNNFAGIMSNGIISLNGIAGDPVIIQNNQATGARVFQSNFRATHAVIAQNGNGSDPLIPPGLRSGIVGISGSTIELFTGTQVLDNNGPGISADINTNVLFGFVFDPAQTVPVTVSGNAGEGLKLAHMSVAQLFSGSTLTGNTTADASCDGSSLLFGDNAGVSVLKCASAERKK